MLRFIHVQHLRTTAVDLVLRYSISVLQFASPLPTVDTADAQRTAADMADRDVPAAVGNKLR